MDTGTLLIGASLILLALELWVWGRMRHIRHEIGSGPGHDIALVLYRALIAIIIVQVAITVRSIAIYLAPPNESHSFVIILDITSQIFVIGAIVWAVLELNDDD